MSNARAKAIERELFYKQLGGIAKLNHTFVNPQQPPSSAPGPPGISAPRSAPLAPLPRHYDVAPMNHNFAMGMAHHPDPEPSNLHQHLHQAPPPQVYAQPPQSYPSPHTGSSQVHHLSLTNGYSTNPQVARDAYPPPPPNGYPSPHVSMSASPHTRDWEQPHRPAHGPSHEDMRAIIAAEIQRHLGQQQQPPVPSQREQQLESEYARLQAWADEYVKEAEEMKAQLRLAEEKASSATKHQSQLAKSIADSERKIAELERMLGEEREANANLRRREEHATSSAGRELEEVKKRLNSAMTEKHNLNERLSLITAEKEKSQDKVKMVRFDNRALQQQNDELRRRRESVERQNEDLRRQLASTESACQDERCKATELSKEVEALNQQLRQLGLHSSLATTLAELPSSRSFPSNRNIHSTRNSLPPPLSNPPPATATPRPPSSALSPSNRTITVTLAELAHLQESQGAASVAASDPYEDLDAAFK